MPWMTPQRGDPLIEGASAAQQGIERHRPGDVGLCRERLRGDE
jgi:hypothetical protein